MKRHSIWILGILVTLMIIDFGVFSSVILAAEGKEGSEVGNRAPDFTLPNTRDEQVRLSAYKGNKNVVLIFYRGEF